MWSGKLSIGIASSALFKTHLCYYATSIAKVRVTSGSILLEIIRKCKMTNREEVFIVIRWWPVAYIGKTHLLLTIVGEHVTNRDMCIESDIEKIFYVISENHLFCNFTIIFRWPPCLIPRKV